MKQLNISPKNILVTGGGGFLGNDVGGKCECGGRGQTEQNSTGNEHEQFSLHFSPPGILVPKGHPASMRPGPTLLDNREGPNVPLNFSNGKQHMG